MGGGFARAKGASTTTDPTFVRAIVSGATRYTLRVIPGTSRRPARNTS
ncbi:hypothetical protein SNOUR_20755 [Streptomyces noursei ATCC 11455]|nr:hypothetical protein SNOUR_20755 [Streptomyces noursei ATCC 11455]